MGGVGGEEGVVLPYELRLMPGLDRRGMKTFWLRWGAIGGWLSAEDGQGGTWLAPPSPHTHTPSHSAH